MFQTSTLQLLRFHFSFFLMPVYWFALGQIKHVDIFAAVLIFIILHMLVYPASNGYNSYMDRDETSIGGLKNPAQPTRQLFYVTLLMDLAALALSFFISIIFVLGIFTYILASRAYSYRGIRLKKYPVAGYLTVVFFQGAVVFFLVCHGASVGRSLDFPVWCAIGASLLIGWFYPLTQIYQHKADLNDQVKTISYLLGYRGTFIFCAMVYTGAFAILAGYFNYSNQESRFLVFAVSMLPVIIYFIKWALSVWKDMTEANFANTMRMNYLASICTNIGFIVVLLTR